MTRRLSTIAVAFALACACGNAAGSSSSPSETTAPGAGDYNAPAGLDACKLLTAADATTILGGPVTPGSATQTSCLYTDDTNHFVRLALGGAVIFDANRKALKATNQQVEDVSGLGDAAYYQVSGHDVTLHVKKSGADLSIQYGSLGGSQATLDQLKASEKQVAQLALSRM